MKQKDEVKQQACDAVLEKEKAVMTQLEDVASMQAKLMSIKDHTDVLEESSDQEALSAKKQMIDRVHQLTDAYKKVNIKPVESAAMSFVLTKEPFPVFGHLFAYVNPHTSEIINLAQHATVGKKVELTVVTKDSNGDCYIKGSSEVSAQLQLSRGNVIAGEVRDNRDGSYIVSFVAEQVGEAKLSVFINREKIKGSPYSILVNRNYETISIDKPSKIVSIDGCPEAVAFSRNGLWAVGDHTNHCIHLFNDKDQLVRKFGSYGRDNGQFINPLGVAFDQYDHIYVADCSNHRIQKFDVDGNYLLQFGSKGAKDGQLHNPSDVTVHNNKVYIADRSNKRISVFQTNGKFLVSFGSNIFGCPSDVAVNANNDLLIDDYVNSCIYIITLDLIYVGKFGSLGSGKDQLYHPHCLTTTLNGYVLVTDTGNHRISIFGKDGKCIHCFGCYGVNNGQFNGPRGIALSPSGDIYVSDYGNKRIQVY